ncbi:Hypothetical predicted protein [Olea europaea subsp. europaea]|uniref:Uncharacterized protein n=1 Tax=Olea europaea subsp. europaea TaxID=158383 RepID=A0A8S0RNE7_OLEEU|nr:Hypothetical predicted protein [Olea europaea subsp. europaea]
MLMKELKLCVQAVYYKYLAEFSRMEDKPWLDSIRANAADLSCLFLGRDAYTYGRVQLQLPVEVVNANLPLMEFLHCSIFSEVVLMFVVIVANSLASIAANLGLLLEPPLRWRTAEVAGNSFLIIGALYEDASSLRHSRVQVGVISSSVRLMAISAQQVTTFLALFL